MKVHIFSSNKMPLIRGFCVYHNFFPVITKFSEKKMKKIFNNDDLICCNTLDNLKKHLKVIFNKKNNILLMSSGNFDNLEINKFLGFDRN